MFYVKIHESNERVVAVCDSDLIGKKFEEKNLILNVSKSFYAGELKSEEEVKKLIKNENNLNLVGKNTVGLAIKLGMIDENNVKTIKGVPYAQVY